MSKQVVNKLFEGHEVSSERIEEVANAIAARSALKKREVSPWEVKEIIEATSGIKRALRILIAQAEKMNLKMLHFLVFATNKRAIHVYEKVGFKKAGWVPKIFNRNGEYIDELVIIREIL